MEIEVYGSIGSGKIHVPLERLEAEHFDSRCPCSRGDRRKYVMAILIGDRGQRLATLRDGDRGSRDRLIARLDESTLREGGLPCRTYQEKEHRGTDP